MTFDLTTLIIVALYGWAHWVGDFVFQTHWQASNKAHNPWALTKHVLSYMVPISALTLALFGLSLKVIPFLMINFCIHWLIDTVTSKFTSYLFVKKEYHNFFVVIGLDQRLHSMTLLATLYWMGIH